MVRITWSPRLARRVVLSRHGLLEPIDGSVAGLAGALVGLHATGTTSPYLQAFARLRRFDREDLDRALYADRSLVRVRCMRLTVFILPPELASIALAATRRLVLPASTRYAAFLGLDEAAYRAQADRVEVLMAGEDRAFTATEIRRGLGAERSMSAVVNLLCDEGRLVRDRPVGSWKSRAFSYRLARQVAPLVDPGRWEPAAAVRALVRAYLATYGPATAADAAWWSGLPLGAVREAVAQLGDEIAPVRVDGWHDGLLVLASDLDRILPGDDGPVSVALVPELDPFVMGYTYKERFLADAPRRLFIDRAGNAAPAVLVDGEAAGLWDVIESPEPAVLVYLLPLGASVRDEVAARAAGLGAFWFGRQVPVVEVADAAPLDLLGSAGFLAPLRKRHRAATTS